MKEGVFLLSRLVFILPSIFCRKLVSLLAACHSSSSSVYQEKMNHCGRGRKERPDGRNVRDRMYLSVSSLPDSILLFPALTGTWALPLFFLSPPFFRTNQLNLDSFFRPFFPPHSSSTIYRSIDQSVKQVAEWLGALPCFFLLVFCLCVYLCLFGLVTLA